MADMLDKHSPDYDPDTYASLIDEMRKYDKEHGLHAPRPSERILLERAKARLDVLDLYPEPVNISKVRISTDWPWILKFTSFEGFAGRRTIFLKGEQLLDDEDLIVHELCHIWQQQHHPVWMPLSYWLKKYETNPFEIEARDAAYYTRCPIRYLSAIGTIYRCKEFPGHAGGCHFKEVR